MIKLRIRRRDTLNWVLERWQDAGVVDRGRYMGQTREEGWNETKPVGYFPTLKHAAVSALDELLTEDGLTGTKIASMLADAEDRIRKMVDEAMKDEVSKPSVPASMPSLSDEDREEVLSSGDPVAAFLRLTGRKKFKRTYDEKRDGLSSKEALIKRLGVDNPA